MTDFKEAVQAFMNAKTDRQKRSMSNAKRQVSRLAARTRRMLDLLQYKRWMAGLDENEIRAAICDDSRRIGELLDHIGKRK